MERKLSSKQIKDIRVAFAYLDTDKNGLIGVEDLPKMLMFLGQNPTHQEENNVKAKYSNDSAGFDLDRITEIIEEISLKSKEEVEEELMMAFEAIDADGDKGITKEELANYMTSMGEALSPEDVDEIMALADVDKNGKVDRHEFVTILCKHIM